MHELKEKNVCSVGQNCLPMHTCKCILKFSDQVKIPEGDIVYTLTNFAVPLWEFV